MRAYLPWILSAVVAPIVGWLVYMLKAKTDVWRMSRQADMSAIQAPFAVLQRALEMRDKENAEMRAELHLVVTNHLAHDAVDREAVVKALTELTDSQRELTEMIREDRSSSSEQRKGIHERLNAIQLQIAEKK